MRYVAIGDSFTEGLGDPMEDGVMRGWADLVAAGLAAGTRETVEYANFAVRGRLLEPIVTEQLDAALALDPKPTLLSLNGGGNDMMRPGGDMSHLVKLTEEAVRRCAESGVRVVLLSGADPSDRLPFGRVMRRRAEALTQGVSGFAQDHENVVFVDVFHDTEIRKAGYWAPDRLHLNAAGHRRVAGLVLTALGHPAEAHAVDPDPAVPRGMRAEARFYREHVLPWINRRLHGQSSGDDRTGKYVDWVAIRTV